MPQRTTPSAPKARPAARRGPSRTRPKQQAAFLARLRDTGTITAAAGRAGVNRRSHYRWLDQDPAYAAAFHDANEEAADQLEHEARRRALEGVEEPVFYRGERVGTTRRYSDQLLILLLMAKRPDQFRDRIDVTRSAAPGVVIDPEILKTLTDDELTTLRTLARKLTGPSKETPA